MKCQLCERRSIWTTFADRLDRYSVKVCEACYHYLWTLDGPIERDPDTLTP